MVQFELLTLENKGECPLEKIDPIILNAEKIKIWFNLKSDKKWMRMLIDGINPIKHKSDWCHLDKIDYQKHKGILFRDNYIFQEETQSCINQYLQGQFIERCNKDELLASSPIFTVVTPNKWRLVFDARGINKFFQPNSMSLPAPTAPIIRAEDKYFAKIDLSNAFMHVPLSDDFKNFFGFNWKGQCYRFVRMPFGWNMAPYFCQQIMERVLRQIRQSCNSRQINCLFNIYYDDISISAESLEQCQAGFNVAIETLKNGGFSVNEKKSVQPSFSIDWIGFKLEQGSITLTQKMKEKIISLYSVLKKHFYSRQNTLPLNNEYYTVGEYLSLLGILNFCARVVHGARAKLSKLMSTLPAELRVDIRHHNDALRLNEQEFYNLKDVVQMMKSHQSLRIQIHEETYEIMTDASISKEKGPLLGFSNGFGSERTIVLNQESKEPFAYKFKDSTDIALFEGLAVYLAIKNCPYYRKNIIVWCDSQVVEYAYKNISSDNDKLTEIVENIRAAALQKNLVVVIRPVRSKLNNADKPSREQVDVNAKWNELFTENNLFPVTLKEHIDTLDNQNHIVQGQLATALNSVFKKDNAAYGLRKHCYVILNHIEQIHGTNAHNLVNAIAQAFWIDKSLWEIPAIRQIIEILRSNGYVKKRILQKIALEGRRPDWMIHGASDPEEEYERKDKNLKRNKKKQPNLGKRVFFEDDSASDSSSSSEDNQDEDSREKVDNQRYINQVSRSYNPIIQSQILGKTLKNLDPIELLPDVVDFSKPEEIPDYQDILQAQIEKLNQNIFDLEQKSLSQKKDEEMKNSFKDSENFLVDSDQNQDSDSHDDDEDDNKQSVLIQRNYPIVTVEELEDFSTVHYKNTYDRYHQQLAYAPFKDENDFEEVNLPIHDNLRIRDDDQEVQEEIDDHNPDPDNDDIRIPIQDLPKTGDVNMRIDGGETQYSQNQNYGGNDDDDPNIDPSVQQQKGHDDRYNGPGSGPSGKIEASQIDIIPGSSIYLQNLEEQLSEKEQIILQIQETLQNKIEEHDQLYIDYKLLHEQSVLIGLKVVESQEANEQLQNNIDRICSDNSKLKEQFDEQQNRYEQVLKENQELSYLTSQTEANISRNIQDIQDRDELIQNNEQIQKNLNYEISEWKHKHILLQQTNESLIIDNQKQSQDLIYQQSQLVTKDLLIGELKNKLINFPFMKAENQAKSIRENWGKKPIEELIQENLQHFKIELVKNENPKTLEGCVWMNDFLQLLIQNENSIPFGINPLAKWVAARLGNMDSMEADDFQWAQAAGISGYQIEDNDEMALWLAKKLSEDQIFQQIQAKAQDLAMSIQLQANLFMGLLRATIMDCEQAIPPLALIMIILRTPRYSYEGRCYSITIGYWGSLLIEIVRFFTGQPPRKIIQVEGENNVEELKQVYTSSMIFEMAFPAQRRKSEEITPIQNEEISEWKTKHIRCKSDNVQIQSEPIGQWENVFGAKQGKIPEVQFVNDSTPVFKQQWDLKQRQINPKSEELLFKEDDPQTMYEVCEFQNSYLQEEEKQGQEQDPLEDYQRKNYTKTGEEKFKTYKINQGSPIQIKNLTKK